MLKISYVNLLGYFPEGIMVVNRNKKVLFMNEELENFLLVDTDDDMEKQQGIER